MPHPSDIRRWRVAILVGYALAGALLTDLICGLAIGAYSSSHFWPLLPCFWLVTSAVVLTAAAIQGLAGKAGTVLVLVLLVMVGLASDGGAGTNLLPAYWRNIGVILSPQNAIDLIRNVIYFGGNNITTPLIVLLLYVVAGTAVIGYLGWIRPARAAAAHRRADLAEASPAAGNPAGNNPRAQPRRPQAGHDRDPRGAGGLRHHAMPVRDHLHERRARPQAANLPFGLSRSSPVLAAAEKTISLKVTTYPNESAVKTAIDQAKIWGGLVASGTSDTLIVVPTISDYAALPLTEAFHGAAKSTGQKLTVQAYAPVQLPPKDPFGLVPAIMLAPLLIGAYMVSTLLMAATGKAAGRCGAPRSWGSPSPRAWSST